MGGHYGNGAGRAEAVVEWSRETLLAPFDHFERVSISGGDSLRDGIISRQTRYSVRTTFADHSGAPQTLLQEL